MKDKLRLKPALAFGLAALAMPLVVSAQKTVTQNHNTKHHHYKLIDIGTLGGPNSFFGVGGDVTKTINSQGTSIAQADTSIPDPFSMVGSDALVNHPVQLRNGILTDLGALSGTNSSLVSWINSQGWAAGFSENGIMDPINGFPETTAVLWKDGKIIDLGSLGGNASGANALNNQGQVVGGALNGIADPFSSTFQTGFIFETVPFYFFPITTQSHAFLWQNGKMNDLGTLGGPDSVAWFVNELGQVAGQSTINSIPSPTTGVPTVDPFFWDHGKMVDIGNLGGTFSFVSGLNNRGQVIGTMNLPGDLANHPFFWDRGVLTDMGTLGGNDGVPNAINDAGEVVGFASSQEIQALAFLWKQGVMINLGTVDGDQCSAAHSINTMGQIVGESSPTCFSAPEVHAFLWENGGPMVDLNTLVPPDSLLGSAGGVAINDRGEITGSRTLPEGDIHAFLLIPCDVNHPNVEGCDYSLADVVTVANTDPAHLTQPPSAMLNGIPPRLRNRMRMGRRLNRFGSLAPTR